MSKNIDFFDIIFGYVDKNHYFSHLLYCLIRYRLYHSLALYCGEFAIVKIGVINLLLNTNVFKSIATSNVNLG